MATSKGSTSKGSVSGARVGHTHTPMGKAAGKGGSGANRRDSATNTSTSAGGSTLRYRSGDVKRTTGSMAKYGK